MSGEDILADDSISILEDTPISLITYLVQHSLPKMANQLLRRSPQADQGCINASESCSHRSGFTDIHITSSL